MFGGSRKRGAAAQPLTRDTADSNAATAAASAFMRRQSNPSLSSAAAAAALKARPMTPTNVAEVQSKRTMRRSPSVSSMTGRRKELTRTPSVGSMMERTFRSPSPGRSPRPASRDAPPVPTLPGPEDLSSNSRRGPRLQTQNFQTASQKLKKDQGSWFGAAAAGNPATVRRASSALQLSSRGPPEPRPGSVSPSINFSYPRARMHSPSGSVQSEPADEHTLVYDPNSRRMVPRRDFARRSLSVRGTPEEKPLKTKKKTVSRSGSYLSKGTLGRTQTRSADDLRESAASHSQDEEEDVQPENVTRPVLVKKPSIVREEPEEEDIEEQASPSQLATIATPTKPAGKKKKKKKTNSANGSTAPSNKTVSQARPDRVPSESPARSTRFASSTDQLVVRHEPPARSLSPRKSALKHSSPTRAISPSDDGSEASALALNTEDAMARKKSARVSWDDRNTVVVGESVQPQETESPMIPSPQTKKPWHGLLAAKQGKKDAITVEKEETMSPRPALPNFGSVREKKTKEPEERPLVRPAERAWSPQPSSTDAGESSDGVSVPDNTAKNLNGVNPETAPAAAVSTEAPDESSSDGGLLDDTSEDELNAQEKDASAEVPTISISHPSPRLPNENDASQDQDANLESRDISTPTPTSQMDDIEEEEDNAADHYSDAYEEISEVEGDGFMSLDAVLENTPDSPTTKSAPANVPTDSNNKSANVDDDVAAPEEQDDWENAKAYWKSLSLDQRRQLEVEALTEGEDTGKKKDLPSSQPDEEATVPKVSTERSYQIQPGTSWDATKHDTAADPSKSGKLRQSLRQTETNPSPRQAQPGSVSMRKSMREARPTSAHGLPQAVDSAPDGAVHMKKSLRQRPATADAQRRPVSYHERSTEVVRSHQRNLSDDGPASPTSPGRGVGKKTTLRRRGSDSSESSFTRKRAGSSGAHEFRRSMRGSMRDAPSSVPSNKDANRFSLRSLSPTGFRRNSVSSVSAAAPGVGAGAGFGAGRMRQSLRGESVGATPRKRMSTFGRSPGKASKGRSGSRFADSSDEEEDGPLQMFRSRFADSSDEEEEEARPASQGRGIAKTMRSKSSRATASAIDLRSSTNGFESSALPIDDDILQPKRELALPPAIATDERPNHSRRGSFMSILRRKKDPNANKLGRTDSEVGDVPNSGAHKRDSSWPLPDGDNGAAGAANNSPGDSEAERPSTAGGPIADTNTKASKFARRRSASQGMVGLNHTTLDDQPETPQKKKKFRGLRKMLGIHD